MNRQLIAAILAAAALVAAGPAHAQDDTAAICRDGETINACEDRLVNSDSAFAAADRQVRGEERQRLEQAATGVNLAPAGVQSSIRDFNPRMMGEMITPSLVRNGTAIGLRWNIPTQVLGKVQLGTLLNDATVYKGVLSAVPEAQRTAVRDQLQERLGPFDDVSFTLAGNVENSTLGRSFKAQQAYFDALFRSARGTAATAVDGSIAPSVALLRLIGTLNGELNANRGNVVADTRCTGTVAQLQFRCFTTQARARLEAALLPTARAERERRSAITTVLKSAGFSRLAELVNNQPQLTFEAESRVRTGAAGPDQFTGKVRVETGFTNVNSMRGYCRARSLSPDNVECLSLFTHDSSKVRSLERGHRLWGSFS
ncbi:MAG TPA: hypothetical protein VFS20_09150, partial [Longimicrobium sp.]|nr:hypothetical protein [Longimicrobium sp.]